MSERGPNTLAVHAGEAPDPTTGASAPNLVMSTTFALEEPAGFSIGAFEGELPYIYTRWGNPTVRMLEEKLAALEGAEDCVAFGSGMAATSALLLAGLKAGDHLVMSDVQLRRNGGTGAEHVAGLWDRDDHGRYERPRGGGGGDAA